MGSTAFRPALLLKKLPSMQPLLSGLASLLHVCLNQGAIATCFGKADPNSANGREAASVPQLLGVGREFMACVRHERLSFPVDGPSPSDQFAERHFTQLSDIRERFPRDCDDIGQLSRFKRAPEIRP